MFCLWVLPLDLLFPASPLTSSAFPVYSCRLLPSYQPLTGSQLPYSQEENIRYTVVNQGLALIHDGSHSFSRSFSESGRQVLAAISQGRRLDFFPSKPLQSGPLKLRSTLWTHGAVILKVKYAERNVLDLMMMCTVKSLWCMYCFCFRLSLH